MIMKSQHTFTALDILVMTYPCGCENQHTPPSGVLRSIRKCPKHKAKQRDPATLDESYYTELGVLKDGRLADTNHVAELVEALGEFTRFVGRTPALEIGCGASPYVAAILEAGHEYYGTDASPWAAQWMKETYGARVTVGRFEDVRLGWDHRLILAAHVLEHLDDAPAAIANCERLLCRGGELWIVVPDDSDPVNPDHIWFFDEFTLRACLEAAGLVVEKMAVRRYVPHENFIYCRARKPS